MTAAVTQLHAGPTIRVVTVTPAMAEQWLSRNDVNRNIRQQNVEKYSRAMSSGKWTMTGEPIKFGSDGRLLDGQHRLLAIIRAGIAVDLVVVDGLEPSAQLDMDSGAKRSASDAIGFLGETNSALLAASARLAFLVDRGLINQDRKKHGVSNSEIAAYVQSNPDLRDAVLVTNNLRRHIDAAPTAICVAYYYLARINHSQAEEFFNGLATRANVSAGSAILALDSRLRSIRKNATRASHRDYLNLFFKAWNYWRRGRTAATLALGGGTLIEPK